MNTSSYLIVLSKGKNFKPLQEKFNQLGGFYNGIGYAFPEKSETELRKLLIPFNAQILNMPLGEGQTFSSLCQSFKAVFFREKLSKKELELLQIKYQLNIDELTEESIASSNLQNDKKKEITDIIQECEKLKKAVIWADGMEKVLSTSPIQEIRCANELIEEHDAYLEKYRGKQFIGLKQVTIPTLDKLTLGIRGNILLAAAPNVGKTALTIQIALDILKHNLDACVLYLSLEMPKHSILSRIRCHLSEMDWETLVLGPNKDLGTELLFNFQKPDRLKEADTILRNIGSRFCIITEKDCSNLSVEMVIQMVDVLKQKVQCKRVFVVLDYLQVWPIPEPIARTIRTDIEADKWRIGQLKTLAEKLVDDPVLSISEARKPSEKNGIWGGEMSDIIGSGRNSYTPDMVLLYRSILDKNGIETFYKKETKISEEQIELIQKKYTSEYCDIQQLKLCKGRDGMKRGAFFLKFYYQKNIFKEINQETLKKEFDEIIIKANTNESKKIIANENKTIYMSNLGIAGIKK